MLFIEVFGDELNEVLTNHETCLEFLGFEYGNKSKYQANKDLRKIREKRKNSKR